MNLHPQTKMREESGTQELRKCQGSFFSLPEFLSSRFIFREAPVRAKFFPEQVGARGFLLFEVMLGVAIFAIGVIALGQAVNNCMQAEAARADDQRARMALQSEMSLIEAGFLKSELTTKRTAKLEDMFSGITINETRTPANLKNDQNKPLDKLYTITIEATWQRGSQPQSKSVSFYGR